MLGGLRGGSIDLEGGVGWGEKKDFFCWGKGRDLLLFFYSNG